MEARQNSIAQFMQQQNAQFIIPVYQRNYDWKKEQCKQLLFDILKTGSDNKIQSHFIGSIVYIQMGHLSSPILTIIDGQQRLTTLTLIIAALSKRANEIENRELAKYLNRQYLINERMNDEEKIKLKPIKKDSEALKFVISNFDGNYREYSRILENYNYFYENINCEQIESVINGIQKLVFIEIGLDKDKDDPQRIFQSLNSTGLDLSQADLIRNYILMGLQPKLQLRIYEDYWVEIEKNTTESMTKNSRLSDLIRDYLTFNLSKIPNIDKVFDTFKEKYNFNGNETYLKEILSDLKKYSRYYFLLINPDLENDYRIKDNLLQIRKLQINVSYPFLLQVFDDYNNNLINTDTLNDVLELVQSFVWRRFICGVATNALNKIFMDLHKEIVLDNYLNSLQLALVKKKGSQRFPNDDEVAKELEIKDMYYIQPKNRTYFLERLENYGYRIKNNIDDNSEVTIEHIFPQNPGKDWKEHLGENYEIMVKYLNTAANLTLSAFNKELSNMMFIKKRDFPEKGYKDSILRIDKYLAAINEWNPETISGRKQWILNRFKEVWKYPVLEMEEEEQITEINILDLIPDDVTGKSIDYYIFFETRYDSPSFRDLLANVVKIMFEREPHMFIASDLSDVLKLTQEQSLLTSAIKISESYWIEGSLSGSNIIKKVQKILDKCETDDELIIKIK